LSAPNLSSNSPFSPIETDPVNSTLSSKFQQECEISNFGNDNPYLYNIDLPNRSIIYIFTLLCNNVNYFSCHFVNFLFQVFQNLKSFYLWIEGDGTVTNQWKKNSYFLWQIFMLKIQRILTCLISVEVHFLSLSLTKILDYISAVL
jgi:hypothetical protein